METPAERRSEPRAAHRLRGWIGRRQPIEVVDLNGAGARIETAEALAPGRSYRFRIGGVWLSGRVVRCAEVDLAPDELGGRPLFGAGVAFEEGGPVQRR